LATLTVESINRHVYTIVELVSDANVRHVRRASADEVIVNNDVTSGLLARAALDHGITRIISDWLSTDHGDELYKLAAPASAVGCSFVDVLARLKQQHGCIVIGIQRGEAGEVVSNPPPSYMLVAGDHLIVVAPERPKFT
jgi:voltage-gated potassium channel